jgi:cell division protein FtsZ
MSEDTTPVGEDPIFTQPRITVFGVGNAGCNAVVNLSRSGMNGVRFVGVSTHARLMAQTEIPERLILAGKLRRGLGAGGDPEQGRTAAEADREKLRAFCEGADVVILVAGLGGGTGSGATPVIAQLAKEAGALVLGVIMLPFDWEGSRRQQQAAESLQVIKALADSVICISNQQLLKLIDDNTSVIEAFDIINRYVEEGVRSVWRLLTCPSLIRVDFGDLCTVTRGRHSESCLATAEAAGANRARDLVERLMNHPLLDNGHALAEAETLLVSLVGGPDLSIAEVSRVMDQVRRHAERAQVIAGTAIEEALGDRLYVTLIASGPSAVLANARQDDLDSVKHLADATTEEIQTRQARQGFGRRSGSRFVPPAPELSPEQQEQFLARQGGRHMMGRKQRLQQGVLPLEIVSRGRFEKSEPTIYRGEDLDVPTFIRHGVALN